MCRYDNLCTEHSSKTAKTAKNQKFFQLQLCKALVKKKSAILLKKGH